MIAIGTDIVYIPRIHNLIEEKGIEFLKKLFSDEEILYCNENAVPSIHFSGKYAAKEAIKKALIGKNILDFISLKDIKILNKPNKVPYVQFSSNISLNLKIDISISHEKQYAIAFALLQK